MNREQRRAAKASGRAVTKGALQGAQGLFADAVRHHRDGRLSAAEKLYREAIALAPRVPEAHTNLGVALRNQGRLEEAVSSYRRALELRPDYPEALTNLGNALTDLGRLDEAVASHAMAVTFRPDYADGWFNLGRAQQGQGRLDEAVASYRKAIQLKPDFPNAHNNMGNVLRSLGRRDEAVASYQKAIQLRPDYADCWFNLGLTQQEQERLDEAVASYRKALGLNPEHADGWFNLGLAQQGQGRLDEAVASYRKAIEFMPDFAKAHSNLGNALTKQGRREEALASIRTAIELIPDLPEAHNNLGNALTGLGRLYEAMASFRKAIELRRDYHEAISNLGIAQREHGRLDEAEGSARKAIELRPDVPETHNNLGNALTDQDRLEEAITSYRKAIELRPDYADGWYNLGNALTFAGCLEEAYRAFARAIDLEPQRGAYYRMLAETGRLVPTDPYVGRMEELASDMTSLAEADQMELHFALGAVYGTMGRCDGAFDHLLAGNRLKRKGISYDEAETLGLFGRVRSAFTAELLAGSEAIPATPLPVFVVGMPRSGTTLVEQILASHPQVFGAGELPNLRQMVDALTPIGDIPAFPEGVTRLPRRDLERLGAAYLNSVRGRAPTAQCIVDKMPGNFMLIGLISMIMPAARIVHVHRDPLDTCMSCFSKLFSGSLPYVYDLAELGQFYRAYEGMMAHWRAVLPPNVMIEVRYEDVVADLEGQAHRLLAHCGVGWDPRCLAFHQTQRLVRTASAAQVRQPLYGSSVGRWHGYGDLARPLLDALQILN